MTGPTDQTYTDQVPVVTETVPALSVTRPADHTYTNQAPVLQK